MKITTTVLTLAAIAGAAHADIIAYTGFENGQASGDAYIDLDYTTDHILVNNPGQVQVSYAYAGTEMGFDAYYRSTGGIGFSDGDFVGFDGPDTYSDSQYYNMNDTDGIMGLQFDTITAASLTSVSIDIRLNETTWETPDDGIHIWAVVDGGIQVDLINTFGLDIDDDFPELEGVWTTITADLTGYTTMQLFVEVDSDFNSESIRLVNVEVLGTVPSPGSIALLGLGGLVASRRRRA